MQADQIVNGINLTLAAVRLAAAHRHMVDAEAKAAQQRALPWDQFDPGRMRMAEEDVAVTSARFRGMQDMLEQLGISLPMS